MEGFGVLRAAQHAGVPAVEVRAISNAIGEKDRARWDLDGALTALERAMPALLEAVEAAMARGS
jgi:futalosine hydrolase